MQNTGVGIEHFMYRLRSPDPYEVGLSRYVTSNVSKNDNEISLAEEPNRKLN